MLYNFLEILDFDTVRVTPVCQGVPNVLLILFQRKGLNVPDIKTNIPKSTMQDKPDRTNADDMSHQSLNKCQDW